MAPRFSEIRGLRSNFRQGGVSPDGRIDSLSVEFSSEVDDESADEIRTRASKISASNQEGTRSLRESRASLLYRSSSLLKELPPHHSTTGTQ